MNNHVKIEGTPAPLQIVTHNGIFHADDAFAVATILILHPNAEVVRTRDESIINSLNPSVDFVVDVGGVHAPHRNRFDHHQQDTPAPRHNDCPYAAFGLVWWDIGHRVVSELADAHEWDVKHTAAVTAAVDACLVQSVDRADVSPGTQTNAGTYSVSRVISAMNPTWLHADADVDTEFMRAVDAAMDILLSAIASAYADEMAVSVIDDAGAASQDGVIVLDKFVPWYNPIHDCWTCADAQFIVFPSLEGTWMVQVIPEAKGSFKARKDLPSLWAGLRDEEFQQLTGVADAIFCHNGRFICGAQSKEGALRLAEIASNCS